MYGTKSDESKYHELYEEAVKNKARLFPNARDESGSSNEIDDLEVAVNLGELVELEVQMEAGTVRTFEMEEDEEIEEQLLSHVKQCAASLGVIDPEEDGGKSDGQNTADLGFLNDSFCLVDIS